MRSTSAINPVTTENTDDSHYKCREIGSCATMNSRLELSTKRTCSCHQRELGQNGDKGESMMSALYILQYAKRHLLS